MHVSVTVRKYSFDNIIYAFACGGSINCKMKQLASGQLNITQLCSVPYTYDTQLLYAYGTILYTICVWYGYVPYAYVTFAMCSDSKYIQSYSSSATVFYLLQLHFACMLHLLIQPEIIYMPYQPSAIASCNYIYYFSMHAAQLQLYSYSYIFKIRSLHDS